MKILINKNRVRKDVRCGDLLSKTNNGWYYPANSNRDNNYGFYASDGEIVESINFR